MKNLMLNKSKIIWIAILLAIGTAIYFSKQSKNEKRIKYAAEKVIEQSELKARYKRGAYIDNESKLSEFETAKTIVYPGKSDLDEEYDKMYDTTCLVYINTQISESKVKCTGLLFDKDDESNGEMQNVESEQEYGRYE